MATGSSNSDLKKIKRDTSNTLSATFLNEKKKKSQTKCVGWRSAAEVKEEVEVEKVMQRQFETPPAQV